MEAIGLFFTKFSDELLSAQIALLSFSLALGVYWMLVRKKKRETAEWVPAALVRAYLDRMRTDEHETRVRLFGENSAYTPAAPVAASLTQQLSAAVATPVQPTMVVSNDPALLKEIEALRAQLSMADQRAMEFDRNLNGLKAEKGTLEQKLREAQSAAPVAGTDNSAANAAIAKELEEAKAKLAEYEVIEDDLANLKKLQKENEQLKQQIAGGAASAAPLTVVKGGASPADSSSTKISDVTEKIETPVTVIPGGAAKAASPVRAAVEAAPAASSVTPSSSEANTNVLAPVTPTFDAGAPVPAAAAPAPAAQAPVAEKSSKQKEEELLSEFEKMLAS
jgi:hypothetical protein